MPFLRNAMVKSQIVALGGSLLKTREGHDLDRWFSELVDLCKSIQESNGKLGIVIGGGTPARYGINLAKSSISDSKRLDLIGIAATKLNATTIQQVLIANGLNVSEIIPNTTTEAKQLLSNHNFVCMGGTTPGHTTDAVATRMAVDCEAQRCVIATDVPYVYDKDPHKFADAIALKSLNLAQLAKICGVGEEFKPGQSAVIDPIAVSVAIKHSIEISVLDGKNIRTLSEALSGKSFEGSKISIN